MLDNDNAGRRLHARERIPVGCRYRLGSSGTAKALTLFREGWSALPIFAPIDRAAVMIVGASMIPYNPPKRQHVRPLHNHLILSFNYQGRAHNMA